MSDEEATDVEPAEAEAEVPVDVYAPGCPPGPETLLHAIITLHQRIQSGELLRRRDAGAGPLVIEQRDGQSARGVTIGAGR